MTWIKTIPFASADGILKKMYHRIKGPDDQVDQILQAHSLRPHTLKGHMMLYKTVLHHQGNTLAKWYLESIGVYVSLLNQCDYCVRHHYEGLKKLLLNDEKSEQIYAALMHGPETFFDKKFLLGLSYAKLLTQTPWDLNEQISTDLKEVGFTEGEILEINQVTAYFNYANRTVLGLGVTTEGEALGLSPNGDDGNWEHA